MSRVLALEQGFGSSPDFWQHLVWALFVDVPLGIREIRVPVTLAKGVLDPIAPMRTPRFEALIPGSTFSFLPWSGNAPHCDQPARLARLVRETAAAGDRTETVLAASAA